MADYGILASPTEKFKRLTLPFFISPRLFTNFASKPLFETESAAISPTSTLDSKPFSGFRSPICSDSPYTPKNPEPNKRNWEKLDSRHIGLGIVDSFSDEKSDPKLANPEARTVLFGSQLKIQVPPPLPPPSVLSPSDSPKSAADFGIKERNSQVGSFHSSLSRSNSARKLESDSQSPHRVVLRGCLPASGMELSEDYTCVIAHGPNPRTTLIFDDCVVESYSGFASQFASEKENGLASERRSFPSESFLSFCHACKSNLGHGKDIYMYRSMQGSIGGLPAVSSSRVTVGGPRYDNTASFVPLWLKNLNVLVGRGEEAFCSRECRYRAMLMEEEMELLESNGDLHAASS